MTERNAALFERLERWVVEPQPVLRLELIRILAPLAILGFMWSRLRHADHWLGGAGFRVPDLGGSEWRQPLYVPALPDWAAWSVAGLMVASGLAVSLGFRARRFAWVFAGLLAFVALSDRLAAFTVSKLSPIVLVVIASSACGRRFGVDAWMERRRGGELPTRVAGGSVRFFQVLLPVFYSASGIAKLQGDWLKSPHVLWTLLHDSYQTAVSWALANALPAPAWTVFQVVTLGFEVLAPIWFAVRKTRPVAFVIGLGMHSMIGLMFGPVKWFSLLMMVLLLASYCPKPWLARVHRLLRRLEGAPRQRAQRS